MYAQTLEFSTVWVAFDQLLAGAALTIRLTAEAIGLGMILAVACAWAKTAGPSWLKPPVTFYIEAIRNTPFLLQLYFLFFGLPSIGIRLAPNDAALLTMVLNLGAYAAEIVRAGIEAVPHGQIEAGRALGLRPLWIFRLIVMPPTLRIVYAPLAGQFTLALLGSSVVSAISANELTSTANLLQSVNFRTFETYLVVTGVYFVMVLGFRGCFAVLHRLLFRNPADRRRVT